MWNRRKFVAILAMAWLGRALGAGIDLPAGSSWIHAGQLDLGGSSMQINGGFDLSTGQISALDALTIGAGGQLNAGTGSIALYGAWTNNGVFNPGTGQVNFIDGGAGSPGIGGNTLFHDLSLVSSTGKTWRFASASTQRVNGLLAIHGTPAQPVQLASTAPGQVAYLNLLAGGTQDIHDVGVSDITAGGQHLAGGQTNHGGSGNAQGWFGSDPAPASVQPIPSLSGLALALLSALLVVAGALRRTPAKLIS